MQGVSATKQIPVTTNYGDTKVEFDLASAKERKAFLNVVDSALRLKNIEIEELQKEVTAANIATKQEARTAKILIALVVLSILANVGFMIYIF